MTVPQRRLAVLAAFVAAGLVLAVIVMRRPQSLLNCVKEARCDDTLAMVGSQKISSNQLKMVFESPELKSVSQSITRSYIPKTNAANHITFLVTVLEGKERAFAVPMFRSDLGDGYFFGPLVIRLLSIKALSKQPKIEMLGDLYRAVADEFVYVQPVLERAGIQRIDIDGKNLVQVTEGANALRKWATLNEETRVPVFRP